MKTEDIVFFYKGSFRENVSFKAYKEIIDKRGFVKVTHDDNMVRVYNPYLLMMLTAKDLPVQNLNTNEDVTINGLDYLETFIKGFNEGREYYIGEFGVIH